MILHDVIMGRTMTW